MKKQRTTSQRKVVLAAVKESKNHPTADEIYVSVYKDNPKISRGTVYRNLNLLSENGEIYHVPIAEGADRFDDRTDPHYHFRCKKCEGVWDLELPYMRNLKTKVENTKEFLLEEHRILFSGFCKTCQENEKKQ